MERNRRLKIFGIVALVLGVLGLVVAFAAMSRVLKINGTGNVDRANWDIHFRNVTFLSKSETASISGDPEPSNTNKGVTITGLNVTLKQPGDYVTYTADIKNEGDIDAAIKLVTPPSLTERQNELFEFKAEYTDVQAKGSKVIQDGDILRAGDIKNITITFKYKDEVVASQLPSQAEAITLTYSILYEQLFEESTETTSGGSVPSKTPVKELDVSKGENDNVTAYFYDDDTISIEGTGEISSDLGESLTFEGDENPYNATSITLGEGITNVPSGIYTANEDITNVNLPSTITKIENNAFEGCTGLTSIEIPSAVTEIGDEAFKNCTNLQTITVGSTSTQGVALKNMANSNTSNITSIGASAFYNCTSLTNVDNIISRLTTINTNTFYNCTGLTRLTIPTSIVSYGANAFSGCTGLTYLSLPGTITIDEGVFANVSNLQEVDITGTGEMANYDFSTIKYTPWRCSESKLKKVTISEGITSIGDYAFRNCTSLSSITIPESVTSIGTQVFCYCTSLSSITIPESVTSIGSSTFEGCTGLTNLVIPESVTSIRSNTFSGCTGLTSITIPESVTSIGDYAFYDCTSLTSITIPKSITSIGSSAFAYCTSITSITIPENVTRIGTGAFSYCTSLTKLSAPGIIRLDGLFKEVSTLEEITLTGSGAMPRYVAASSKLTPWYISRNNIRKITIGEGITSIGQYAFAYCTGLTNITIPNSITSIERYAFRDWTSEQTINIDNTSSYVASNWNSSWNSSCSAVVNYLRD